MTHDLFHTKSKLKTLQFNSLADVNSAHWGQVVGENNVYLSVPYLSALEDALKENIEFRYTMFYSNKSPVAVSYVQIMHYKDNDIDLDSGFCHIGDKLRSKLIDTIDARVLICGNVFACGENGFAFTSEIEPKEAFIALAKCMRQMAKEKESNGQISFGLLKEFWPTSLKDSDTLEESNFRGFEIDVNMVLNVSPKWESFDDYLNAMSTKFRTKAKGVMKKSARLKVETFELQQIIDRQERIEELYLAVLNNAEFKFGELNAKAFINFKQNLKDRFVFRGYFLKGKLIGFITAFICDDKADANYIGLDYEFNKEYAVYQRMLYDLVDLAIHEKLVELRLGRTAETLKSSVGAEPVNMKLYIRHRNSFSNSLIGPLVSSISPSEFELRPPFKKEFA